MQKKANSGDDSKRRHIVTWSQEEDDILREQIRIYGTDNWTIIASKYKDKTTRQCRRRWYTYLNSDFKKGGWSPEEDLLLCEAQRIYGNRWTEIAKVVSGRTDNAVKNRFTTLCKKRAKYEALSKENSSSYINLNNKRVITHCPQYTTPENTKRIRRAHIPEVPESCDPVERLQGQPGSTSEQLRTPFSVLVQNMHRNLSTSHHQISDMQDTSDSDLSNKGTFLKKDDPKVGILMQQAQLLSSLAVQVHLESTDQSFENAWKVLQDFLNQRKDGNISKHITPDTDFQQDFRELLEDLVKSSNGGSQGSWRQPDLREDSPSSSEYSTGSTIMDYTVNDKNQQIIVPAAEDSQIPECEDGIFSAAVTGSVIIQPCDVQIDGNGGISTESFEEFGSPIQVTPLFRSLGAGIPSPKFSESERSFLMRTLGMDSSPSPALANNPSHPPPPCKKALLQCL